MYFNDFNKIAYKFIINGKEEYRAMTDITLNVRVRKEILSNITLFDQYIISDGESIEYISEKIYGGPEYHWAIMLANDRYDYITDFPLADASMEQFIIDKYGVDNIYDTHHYERTANGITYITDSSYTIGGNTYLSTSVSNSDYEYRLNESKRIIKVISPSIIDKVAAQLGELL